MFVSNPGSNNVSLFNFDDNSNILINAGNSPVGLALHKKNNKLFVSNWYDNVVSAIDLESKRIIKIIEVGKSPAGMYVDENLDRLFVANREDNNISVININNYDILSQINVQKAPFGIYSEEYLDYLVVTNVQSNSITLIDKSNLKIIKNIKVGKWPYSVVHNKKKNHLYVTNQRDDSISIIDMNKKINISSLDEVCEYPEGIDISYTENLIIVACWFEDNIILINLSNLEIVERIKTSGGPRAFGDFILGGENE